MTRATRRGLQVAKRVLREHAHGLNAIGRSLEHDDILVVLRWIALQERHDERRRKPRGRYKRGGAEPGAELPGEPPETGE